MLDESFDEQVVDLAGRVSDPDEAAARLVELAGGQRRPLEEARRRFVRRLHRASNDYDATRGLRLTSRALERLGREPGEYPQLGGDRAGRRRGSAASARRRRA